MENTQGFSAEAFIREKPHMRSESEEAFLGDTYNQLGLGK